MPRWRAVLLTVVALGLTAGAPAARAQDATRTVDPDAAAAARQAAGLPEAIDYVALGDSYTAAPLVPDQRTDPFGCFRSWNNYPAYLAGWFQVSTYTDVSCSGADVADFFSPQPMPYNTGDAPPQLDAVTADTDLVTIGIGGNDFSLFGSMVSTCQQVAAQDPDGKPCKRAFTRHGVDTKARDARRIEARVARAVAAVRERAPQAQVWVVGYPRLLPSSGTCADVPFATGDYAWATKIERLLNRSLREGAAAAGGTYVGLWSATLGHDACAGDLAWINGATTQFGVAAAFHPFQAGERGNAAAVYAARTGGLVAPDDADAEPPADAVVLNPRAARAR